MYLQFHSVKKNEHKPRHLGSGSVRLFTRGRVRLGSCSVRSCSVRVLAHL